MPTSLQRTLGFAGFIVTQATLNILGRVVWCSADASLTTQACGRCSPPKSMNILVQCYVGAALTIVTPWGSETPGIFSIIVYSKVALTSEVSRTAGH